ncbi:hypothetical protein T10_1257 [Trichinella papuae]|uniref:RRM domain-containing protein n=1 Tax=Trichinella papuae TaxID=268474 RepID=A0A0V1MD00_9BILA|nr:hypothetical protein T10_1257 [Trichinella papuae]
MQSLPVENLPHLTSVQQPMKPHPILLNSAVIGMYYSLQHGQTMRDFLFEVFNLSSNDPLILDKYCSLLQRLVSFSQECRDFVHNMIFVEMVDGRMTVEHLFRHFCFYGNVLQAEIRPENPQLAIVTFQTPELARAACYISKNFHYPHCTIICSYIYNLEHFVTKCVRDFLFTNSGKKV